MLVQHANPERRLRELDYANNAASALVRVSWPSGRARPPRVDVLRTLRGERELLPARGQVAAGAPTIRVVERFDVLVAGAGPAGSSTAIHLARAGARVLLADKARFPRDKPCGGGLTGRALKRIPVDPSPVVERDVDRFELRLRYGPSFSRSHDEPLIRMTQRRRLDAFLAAEAADAGAELREGAAVGGLAAGRPRGDRGGRAATASAPTSSSAPTARTGSSRAPSASVTGSSAASRSRGTCPLDALAGDLERTAVIELATVPGGYGWVFPKGDHANLGVGGWGSEGPRLRDHLATLARAHGVDPGDADRGARAPAADAEARRRPPARGRVLLVGDAAGLVDPLSGDGMYEAFVSARLAADAILAGDLDALRRRRSPRRSTATPRRRGRRSARSTAIRGRCSRPRARPGVFRSSRACSAARSPTRRDARGVARGPLKLIARLAG